MNELTPITQEELRAVVHEYLRAKKAFENNPYHLRSIHRPGPEHDAAKIESDAYFGARERLTSIPETCRFVGEDHNLFWALTVHSKIRRFQGNKCSSTLMWLNDQSLAMVFHCAGIETDHPAMERREKLERHFPNLRKHG